LLLPLGLVGGMLAYGVPLEAPVSFDAATAARVAVSEPSPLVPGPGLPAELVLGAANNNLDVARLGDRFFLGFRSAPHHFASDDARMLVLSSADRLSWRLEATFDLDRRDLREPRFLVLGERLLFYFFEAEDDPLGFAPIGIRVAERRPDGTWTDSRRIFDDGHVVWRAKARGGRAWMSVYDGRRLYDDLGQAGGVRLLVSDDGIAWRSLSGEESVVPDPGASECAFEFDRAGNLVALVRVEARGAMVCTAPASRLERWDCEPTGFRHDSPILFRQGDAFYAVARRNLAGAFGPEPGQEVGALRQLFYLLRYSASRKRTALYRVLPEERRTLPVLDLPGRGDTAFAGVVPLGDGRWWVVNYTSHLDGPDWPWIGGQLVGTVIYGVELELR
jgi:hypothetical protein